MTARNQTQPPFVGPRANRRRTISDVAVALLLVLLLWMPGVVMASGVGLWVCVVSAVAIVVFLPLRWRFPRLAPVVVVAATVAAVVFEVTIDMGIAAAWTLFPLALKRGAWRSWTLWFLFGLISTAALGAASEGNTVWLVTQHLAICAIVVAGSWLLGSMVRAHSDAVAAEAVAEAERASAEDQLEIAREVHDVVGHTLGVIGMEAGVARMNPDASPEQLRETLESVEASARESLEQVQGLLRTLRGGTTTPESSQTQALGISDLPTLVERTRAAGIPVVLEVDADLGSGQDAPNAATQLAIYRIVQEGLANVVRHAPGASAQVSIRSESDQIYVRVHNDRPGDPSRFTEPAVVGTGHGLVGIRERARLLGGRSEIASTPDGGFEVNAWLPLASQRLPETLVKP